MSLYACAVLLNWSGSNCHSGTCALYYPKFNSGCTCITFQVSVLRFESPVKYESHIHSIIIWVLILFFPPFFPLKRMSSSKSVPSSSVWAVKFSVSPQSSQAWRIKCRAADKQLISITGRKSVNVTLPDESSFHVYIFEKHAAIRANEIGL